MQYYGQPYSEVMAMPLKTFWLLSNNIDRIEAQKDLRLLSVNVSSGANATTESVQKMYESLQAERGEVVKIHPLSKTLVQRDEQGISELKAMADDRIV